MEEHNEGFSSDQAWSVVELDYLVFMEYDEKTILFLIWATNAFIRHKKLCFTLDTSTLCSFVTRSRTKEVNCHESELAQTWAQLIATESFHKALLVLPSSARFQSVSFLRSLHERFVLHDGRAKPRNNCSMSKSTSISPLQMLRRRVTPEWQTI